MRPLRLSLSNYRGYAALDLDLSGCRSVLFFGPTGAGKSAIPGAMLWALTGKSGSADSRGHVRQGADTCHVAFTFAHAGATYRVIRGQSVGGARGKSTLSLAVSDGNGGWVPQGGKALADTEAAIERLLGMGYEELMVGPFSLQDRAGLFVDPPELRIDGKAYRGRSARLQVTIKMLGLSRYEQLRIAATAAARAVEGQAALLEAQCAGAAEQLAGRAALADARGASDRVAADCRQRSLALQQQIEASVAELATAEASLPPIERQLAGYAEVRRTLAVRQQAHGLKQATAARYRDLLGRRESIEAAVMEAARLDGILTVQRQDLAALGAEGKAAAEQAAAAERQAMWSETTARDARRARDAAVSRVAARGTLRRDVGQLTAARADRHAAGLRAEAIRTDAAGHRRQRDTRLAANTEAQLAISAADAEDARIRSERAGLEPLLAGHTARVAVLDTVPCLGVPGLPETCPLLAEARASQAQLGPLTAQHEALCRYRRPDLPAPTPTDELDAALCDLTAVEASARADILRLDDLISTLQAAEAQLVALDTVAETIPGLESQCQAAEAAQTDAAAESEGARAHVARIRNRYLDLQAAIKSSEAARGRLSTAGAEELPIAARDLPGLERELLDLAQEISALQEALAGEPGLRTMLDQGRVEIGQVRALLARLRADAAGAVAAEQQALQAAAEARAQLAGLDRLAAEAEAARTEAVALRARHTVLVALSEAYTQIPVMILENIAVPVLEEEANRILARTTANGMQVRLETQREVKSRDTLADGLEIHVRDWRGERSIDDFSGGQRFELFLAFRVAWTRLQARRSGAGIDMLFVDEGFGALSEGDLAAVMEALRSLQDEFLFLGVISHVPAMRDVFPARVEVAGGDTESRAELVLA